MRPKNIILPQTKNVTLDKMNEFIDNYKQNTTISDMFCLELSYYITDDKTGIYYFLTRSDIADQLKCSLIQKIKLSGLDSLKSKLKGIEIDGQNCLDWYKSYIRKKTIELEISTYELSDHPSPVEVKQEDFRAKISQLSPEAFKDISNCFKDKKKYGRKGIPMDEKVSLSADRAKKKEARRKSIEESKEKMQGLSTASKKHKISNPESHRNSGGFFHVSENTSSSIVSAKLSDEYDENPPIISSLVK